MLRISSRNRRPLALVLSALVIISSIAGAVFTAPVCVFALSAGGIQSTIASIIISLMLQCGVAPVNTNYLNTLNTAYGYTIETAISEGLLTETASGLVDSGLSAAIEGASAYSELGLGDIFSTTAADVGVTAASGGVNIVNTAINVGSAGTIGAFAGAVAVGVGVGVLANHIRERIGNLIRYGFPMDVDSLIANTVWNGRPLYTERGHTNGNVYTILKDLPNGTYGVLYKNGDYGYTALLKSYTGSNETYTNYNYTNSSLTAESTQNIGGNSITSSAVIGNNSTNILKSTNYEIFDDRQSAENYLNSLSMQDIPSPISPDIIGPDGNHIYDSGNNSYPGIVNQIPEGADMEPVDMNDYLDYADNANNNTADGNTGASVQGEAFDDLIDPLIVDAPAVPDTPIIPDQPVDIPTVPNRPVVPDQPDIPDKPGITQEQMDEALQGATTIDLTAIFPFCIPFDLYNLFLIIDTGENRKAPHIVFTFPLTNWQIDVDLAPFNPVAAILRVLELILFIVGLAVATRSLIGAGGG